MSERFRHWPGDLDDAKPERSDAVSGWIIVTVVAFWLVVSVSVVSEPSPPQADCAPIEARP